MTVFLMGGEYESFRVDNVRSVEHVLHNNKACLKIVAHADWCKKIFKNPALDVVRVGADYHLFADETWYFAKMYTKGV